MRMHISLSLIVLLLGIGTSAGDVPDLPPNLIINPELNGIVAHMLRSSPRFRGQRDRIRASPRVRVRLALEHYPVHRLIRHARAQCDMERHEFGALIATIRIWSRPDAVELIAHELEHVLEAAEGTNYRALAIMQPSSVWRVSGGQYETARAIDMGLRVKREAGS